MLKASDGYLHHMTPPAVMLATALAVTLLLNFFLQGSSLWYWFPVQYDDSIKLYALATEKRHYDVITIGSSVSARDLIPQVMEEELNRLLPKPEPWLVYDASVSAGDFPAFIAISRSILSARQQPRAVILMFSTFNFNANRTSETMALQIKLFSTGAHDFFTLMRHAPRADSRLAAIDSLTHGLTVLMQSPLLRSDRGLVRDRQQNHGSTYYYPFTPEAVAANNKMLPTENQTTAEVESEKVRIVRERNLTDFEIGPLIQSWMQELIGQLRAKNIKVIVTLAPESSWFMRAAYRDEREKSARYLAEFAAREGIIYQDLSEPPYHPAAAEYFDGADHLGPQGAERLSRQIAGRLLVPALAGAAR